MNIEVELGFSAEQTAREVLRCMNCDIETQFTAALCIECDACVDVCPVQCLTITRNGEAGASYATAEAAFEVVAAKASIEMRSDNDIAIHIKPAAK